MPRLEEIEKLTDAHVKASRTLADKCQSLEDGINDLKKRHLKGIKGAASVLVGTTTALQTAIKRSEFLFQKPRTKVISGVKIGFQKKKGTINWDDDAHVIKLIKKHFPDKADVLIKTTHKPDKSALNNLTVAELKKIGVEAKETGDEVIIKSLDTEVDKYVKALLKEDEDINDIKAA